MDAHDMLFIRACKSKNPQVRLRSLIRRLYGHRTDEPFISLLLSNVIGHICEKYCPISAMAMVNQLDPVSGMSLGVTPDTLHWEAVAMVFSSHIRLSNTSCYPDLIIPIRFRRWLDRRS